MRSAVYACRWPGEPTRSEGEGEALGGAYSAPGGLLLDVCKGGGPLGRPCAAWLYFLGVQSYQQARNKDKYKRLNKE
jgi:hypothetical protein